MPHRGHGDGWWGGLCPTGAGERDGGGPLSPTGAGDLVRDPCAPRGPLKPCEGPWGDPFMAGSLPVWVSPPCLWGACSPGSGWGSCGCWASPAQGNTVGAFLASPATGLGLVLKYLCASADGVHWSSQADPRNFMYSKRLHLLTEKEHGLQPAAYVFFLINA